MHTIFTVPPCIHAMDSCHVSSQHDLTVCLGDFLAGSACGIGGSHAPCFHLHHVRLDRVDRTDDKYPWHICTEARWIPFTSFFP